MAKEFRDKQVINGTWGEVWVEGEYIGEIEEFSVEINLSYEEVLRSRHLEPGQKLVKVETKGAMKCHKVRDMLEAKVLKILNKGKTPEFQIIGKVANPDADGETRICVDNCKFDKITLMDFKVGKNAEQSCNFTCDMPEKYMNYIK